MAISKRWFSAVAVIIAFLLGSGLSEAQVLKARVSVKMILDENGNRPTEGILYQHEQIRGAVDVANEILDGSGADWRIDLVEIVDLAGVSQWYGPFGSVVQRGIEAGSASDPVLYEWRTDAINIYVVGDGESGGGWASGTLVVLNNKRPFRYIWEPPAEGIDTTFANGSLILHEIGHVFGLRHTHGAGIVCLTPDGEHEGFLPVGDDGLDDTLTDLDCWSPDSIAKHNFEGAVYAELDAEQQEQIDNTYYNTMSYHNRGKIVEGRSILTADQLAFIAAAMGPVSGERAHVLNLPRPAFTVEPESIVEFEEVAVDAAPTVPDPGSGSPITTYAWDFGDGSPPVAPSEFAMASHTYDAPGRYRIRLTVTDDRGLWMISEQTVAVRLGGDVSPPWTAQDIGAVTGPGGARSLEDGCLLVQGSVGTVSGRSDRFHYVAQPVEGDFSLTARIHNWQNVSTRFARVGLMVRESLNEDARHGAVFLEQPTISAGTFRHRFLHRSEIDGSTGSVNHDSYESPELWLRIDRIGDSIQGFVSEDGISWGEPDTVILEELAGEVHVGVAASGQPTVGLWSVATICPSITRPHFLRGDCNGDGKFDISDGVSNLNSLFGNAKPSNCTEACNANDDAQNDIADPVYVFNFLFGSGAPPAAPYPACGEDPDPAASLGCGRFECE